MINGSCVVRGSDLHVCWFEPIQRDGVMPAVKVYSEKLVTALDHSVWAIVQLL